MTGSKANSSRIVSAMMLSFLCLMLLHPPESFATSKRIAVLYFDDHSQFDSPTGCGCIPSVIGKIFSGKGRLWELKSGFRELLNRKLDATGVYESIPQDEILNAMASLQLSRKDIRKDIEKRRLLAKQLSADALVAGDVRKFGQERARANASRSLQEGSSHRGGGTTSFVTGLQVLGYVYTARIKLEMQFYGLSGKVVATPTLSASKRHQLGGAQIAAFRATVTEEGTELNFGQSPRAKEKFRPIVRPARLSSIRFGSPEYNQTLFGIVTDDLMLQIVKKLRMHIGPDFTLPSETAQNVKRSQTQSIPSSIPITGTVIHVDTEKQDNSYINLGSAAGVKAQQQFDVYAKGEPLTDPDTGEVLDYIPVKVGRIEIVEVRSDRVSRVKIIDGLGEIKRGNKVRKIQTMKTQTVDK